MEDLYASQIEIFEAIKKLATNFKKDGAERKNADYFKRRLETLENYWGEFQHNHDRICTEISRDHQYFQKKEYEQTCEYYKSVKQMITQQFKEMVSGYHTPKSQPGTSTGRLESEHIPQMESRGNSSKLEEMLRKQFANFKAFTRTVNQIDVDVISEKWEFDDVLKSLQSRWTAIDSLHWEIDSELNGDNVEYDLAFNQHESTFNNLKKLLNAKMWSSAHRDKITPQLEIPIFHGNYNQWISFKDLFQEAIHKNTTLSKAQKMQFLKAKLKGEAERLLQHLPISTENYDVCWELLQHRYNNTKLIFSSHLNTILNIPNQQQQSLPFIKKLHDVTLECLNGIKNLGVNIDTWDPIIVHLLSHKLDSDSHSEYIGSLENPRELPILQDFIKFLENKFNALESSQRKPDNKVNNQQKHNISSSFNAQKQQPRFKINYSNNYAQSPKIVSTYYCAMCNMANHGLFNCHKFMSLPNNQKLQTISKLDLCSNCLLKHNYKNCFSTKRCQICAQKHNTLLHDAFNKPNYQRPSTSAAISQHSTINELPRDNVITATRGDFSEVLLATAKIDVLAEDGVKHSMRALIDQGSQISIITEKAAQILKLKRQKCHGVIFGVGEKQNNCKGLITLTCTSIYNNYSFTAEVFIMNNLIRNLPNGTFEKPTWSHIKNINLADPDFNISSPVDLLFGADIYSQIMMNGMIKGEHLSEPIAQQTQLGWLLCGNMKTFQCNVIINNLDDIHKFCEIEDVAEASVLSSEDQHCIDFYKQTTQRQANGRYQVRLPLKEDFEKNLGTSKPVALAQFRSLESKLNRQHKLAAMYREFMNEYKELGHMKRVSGNLTPTDCYLPHHGVQRVQSTTTKLRVVFNASAKTSTGQSLNDQMYTGPNLQQDLQSLILRWRQFRYVYTADIEKMFRNIDLFESDQALQKIVWRDSPDAPIQSYQLTTVTYGTKSAPFLAMMTLKQLAADNRDKHPETAKIIEESFYMDDLIHGAHSIQHGTKNANELQNILQAGGFKLRKWSANEPQIINSISSKQNEDDPVFKFQCEHTSKTLGLYWNPKEDNFMFQSSFEFSDKITKRTLLSDISKLYDPLGWLAPTTIKLKILFQEVWKTKTQWDDKLPEHIIKQWKQLKEDINMIACIKIPRWLRITSNSIVELHGFCDASYKAYACVIYCRINHHVTLVAAKTKLVPTKKDVSIPRLELCGALLLAKLMVKIKQCLSEYEVKCYGWTDSMVTLGWLNGDPGKWKPFVANRVKQIVEVINPSSWQYIKSEENPADSASRGISLTQLKDNILWWNGPTWLPVFKNNEESPIYETNEELKRKCHVSILQNSESIINKILTNSSSFSRATRVMAWISRFISRDKSQNTSYLSLAEINIAKHKIIKSIQETQFEEEFRRLKKGEALSSKSKLLCLNPYLDEHGLLRVGGRLRNANINTDMQHPVIVPHSSRLTELIIDDAHKLTFHGGPRLTLAFIRQRYWIVGGNRAVKKRLRQCVICVKNNPRPQHQIMGNLPEARCNPARPFYHTGVDYTGFIMIKSSKGRGIRSTKGYIAVFICLSTKAVHLEVVSDLTTSAFLAALKRMAARRGTPGHMYSDNGTNFIGANRVLDKEFQQIQDVFNQQFLNEITDMEIIWHFNAPSWPSAGGLWEAAVKSLKTHTKKVIGEQKLTYEELSTLLAQLETCLNTRPLCPLTEDPEDLNCLTPAHFLTNGPTLTLLETEHDLRTRWYLVEKTFQDLWKRWRTEYLAQLTTRSKWKTSNCNIQVGDLVTINDANLPAGKWAMGRVIELHPGTDGLVRVVSIKTKNGIIKRPVVKLSILPIKTEPQNNDKEKQANSAIYNSSDVRQKTRRKMPNFIALALCLLYFLSILTTSHASYNITELKLEQGLYFDKISNMQLIRDHWKIVVYYDMDPYWQGVTAFDQYLKVLDTMCSDIKTQTHCEITVLQLRHSFSELAYYDQLLLTQHAGTRPARRRRRGLINGVGYVANTLFGVLDAQFAERYQKDIALLKRNEQHLANLWKNQTSVVEAEYNLLKRSELEMDKLRKLVNRHFLEIEKTTNEQNKEINILSRLSEFTLCALTSSNILNYLKSIQEVLLDTVTDIYHGKFNFHLISPEQLRNELSIVSSQISKELSLPIKNIHTDLGSIYQFLRVRTRTLRDYLLFEISVPLTSRDNFAIYNIIPVPFKTSKDSMIKITPISEMIAINIAKDSYLKVNKNDVRDCYHNSDTYFCYLQKSLFHMKADDNLCEADPVTKQCRFSTLACDNEWNDLSVTNKYIYFCCNKCQLRVMCGDHMSVEQLTTTGIISIGHGCLLKNDKFTIYAHNDDLSVLKIKPMISMPKMDPINHIINTSISWDSINQTTANLQTLDKIANSIKEMKERSPEISEISYHDVHHYVAIYGILGGISIIGVVIAWKRIRHSRTIAPVEQRPATAMATEAATGSGQRPEPSVFYRKNTSDQCDSVSVCDDGVVKFANSSKINRGSSPRTRIISFDVDT